MINSNKHQKQNSLLKITIEMIVIVVIILLFGKLLKKTEDTYYKSAYPIKYESTVLQYAKEFKIPQALVFAVIKNESSFNPEAVSSIGAIGLMQITEDTFDFIKFRLKDVSSIVYEDLFDPTLNIKYGTALLGILYKEFKTYRNVLCAYHAGWGSVKKWLADSQYAPDGKTIETIPFDDTAIYVERVLTAFEMYEKIY
ncbi:MAG: lytic transglycosylase domain-containing protein [Oscillospiraceae bacterium]